VMKEGFLPRVFVIFGLLAFALNLLISQLRFFDILHALHCKSPPKVSLCRKESS